MIGTRCTTCSLTSGIERTILQLSVCHSSTQLFLILRFGITGTETIHRLQFQDFRHQRLVLNVVGRRRVLRRKGFRRARLRWIHHAVDTIAQIAISSTSIPRSPKGGGRRRRRFGRSSFSTKAKVRFDGFLSRDDLLLERRGSRSPW